MHMYRTSLCSCVLPVHLPCNVTRASQARLSIAIESDGTSCPAANFALVKSLGATHVSDYQSPTCASEIRHATPPSAASVQAAIGQRGGGYISLVPAEKLSCDDTSNATTSVYTVPGQRCTFSLHEVAVNLADVDFAVMFLKIVTDLLQQGRIQVHKPYVSALSLEAVPEGLQ